GAHHATIPEAKVPVHVRCQRGDRSSQATQAHARGPCEGARPAAHRHLEHRELRRPGANRGRATADRRDHRVVRCVRRAGDSRLAFLYDSSKLTLLEEVGEVAFPPKDNATVSLAGITQAFAGFDRNPYVRLRETSLCSATSTCRRPTRPTLSTKLSQIRDSRSRLTAPRLVRRSLPMPITTRLPSFPAM